MFEVYTMYNFENPFIVKLHCEERRCPMLCVSDRVPPFMMMSLDEALPYLTEEDYERFRKAGPETFTACIPGSRLKLRYYLAILCDFLGYPIAVPIKGPDVFICVAMSVKEYNRRVGAEMAITEEDLTKAMTKLHEKEEA